MLRDRHDNILTTGSQAARDAYVAAVDAFLAGAPLPQDRFAEAVAHDPGFALGHAGLARARQAAGDMAGAREAVAEARARLPGATARESAHVGLMELLIAGRGPEAREAARAHLADHPRDAMAAQTCMGVFGLIGFSGLPGREEALLAFTEGLAPHWGDDWWFLGQHAFALCETGRTEAASTAVDRSLTLEPRNVNAAHVRAHVWYETGEAAAGLGFLSDWLGGYDRRGILHSHLSWHVALWALEQGDAARMWRVVDADVGPEGALGQPINVLTDTASILFRAELAGETVDAARWRAVSDYARRTFPAPGVAFADVHAALAHAMAGEGEALEAVIAGAKGPAADVVRALAEGFRALASGRWAEAAAHLAPALETHARIGGSRAQRDLVEFAMLCALLRLDRRAEARRLIAARRPRLAAGRLVRGLEAPGNGEAPGAGPRASG